MKIIIIGDGKIGYTLATYLAAENHEVTIIDTDLEALKKASETLDVICLRGNGARVSVLQEAGADKADLLIAVTSSDELNMVCCLTAKRIGTERTIARIRDAEYYLELKDIQKDLGIAMVINPELTAAREIANILRFPSASNVELFAGGKVEMVEFKVGKNDIFANRCLAEIEKGIPTNFLVCAVERAGETVVPNGSFVILPEDKISVIGKLESMKKLFRLLGRDTETPDSVMIIGGSRIAYYLVRLLSDTNIKMKIIEIDPAKCDFLYENLENVSIIQGDGTDHSLLDAENISRADAFIPLTGRDEENLILGVYAAACGVPRVIVKNNRIDFPGVAERLGLDCIIRPKTITANHILRYVRAIKNTDGSVIESLYKIAGGTTEVIEFKANQSVKFLKTPLRDIRFKKDVLIAVIVHGGDIVIPHGNEFISDGDTVIIATSQKGITDLNDILD
jgi:trk system potassium uptake protein TrkA